MSENDNLKLPFFLSDNEMIQWTGYWHSCRRILITGELNSDSLKKSSLELIKLDYENSEPITIMIESGGGSVVPTHQFEDMMSVLNSPVDIIIMGNCASIAVDLVQMCRRRMILPSARMLVHYIRNEQRWVCDDMDQMEVDIGYFRERMRSTGERRLNLYTKRTGLSRERIRELFRHGEVHQSYFSAEQAIELKLADEIVSDFKLFPRKQSEEKK